MKFPQYLWRIRTRDYEWVLMRRGNDWNEPIEKYLRKDRSVGRILARLGHGPVGVSDHCDLGDHAIYSSNHPWDWVNE